MVWDFSLCPVQSCPLLPQQMPSAFSELGHSCGAPALEIVRGWWKHHVLPPAEGGEVSSDAVNGKSLGKDLVAREKAEEQWQRAQARSHWGICGA